MGTLVPGQMYDHTLVPVKGAIAPRRLDFAAPVAVGQTIVEGMCASLNDAGEFIAGCPAGAGPKQPMPIFVINSDDDFDTNSDVGNISGGVMSGLVGSGAFEVETTEFTGTNFVPNELLKAPTGTLERATVAPGGVETIVGVVSKTESVNRDGIAILTFWTEYLPAGV